MILLLLLIGIAHAQVGQIGPPTLFVPPPGGGTVCSSFVTDYSVPCNLIVLVTTGIAQ